MPTDDLIPIEHFREIFKGSPSLYVVLTPDFKMVAANDARYHYTLTKPEDVIGKNLFDVFTDDPTDPFATGIKNLRASLETVIRTHRPDVMPVQKYSIAKAGLDKTIFEERYWLPINSPIFDKNGEILYIIHKVEDITQFVQSAEVASQEDSDELTKLTAKVFRHSQEIRRINHELKTAHTQELQARTQAESSLDDLRDERKFREQFTASISHDLRTPLTAAKIGAQIISRTPYNKSTVQKQSFRIIHNLERADQMIQNILDVSRIRAGQTPLIELTRCDIHSILESALQELSTIYGDRFVLRSPSSPTIGFVDCNGLQRIAENLCSNAIKYGDPEKKITVSLEDLKEHIKISIHNWGQPISKENQAVLFRPYHRIKSSRTQGIKGWGIGLTVVQGIVQAHRGSVHVSSSSQEGTTFTIVLPKTLSHIEDGDSLKPTGT